MATTKTRRELVDQALANYDIPGTGQTATAEVVAKMDKYVDAIVEMLAERDIVEVDDVEAIPVAWFLPLADIMSGAAAAEFGMSNDPRIILNADRGERLLHEMLMTKPTGNRAHPEYF